MTLDVPHCTLINVSLSLDYRTIFQPLKESAPWNLSAMFDTIPGSGTFSLHVTVKPSVSGSYKCFVIHVFLGTCSRCPSLQGKQEEIGRRLLNQRPRRMPRLAPLDHPNAPRWTLAAGQPCRIGQEKK